MEREQQVQQVLSGTALAGPQPDQWAAPTLPLRDYQRRARDLVRTAGATLIVDELGLGKTLTSLALLEDPQARPALVIAMTGLTPQWIRELRKFYPQLSGTIIRTTKADKEFPRIADERGNIATDLVVMNYHKIDAWRHHLTGRFNTIIFDEIQELRNADTLKYSAAQALASEATYKAGLSATPVMNYGGDLFNIMNVLRPGSLGSWGEFAREWDCTRAGADRKIRVGQPTALRTHLASTGMFLRRTREDVGLELPPITSIEQFVDTDHTKFAQLQGDAVAMARLILDQSANSRQRWSASGEFDMRMRQATGIAKAPFVAELVNLLLESEQKIVLFGWHRAVYDIWLERLAKFEPAMYTGSESLAAKTQAFERFTDPDSHCRVLIMSLRSGAGLDGLQDAASVLVFGELDWSPGIMKQCIGRLGRPGQNRNVSAYFCTSDHGSDPPMLDVLNVKSIDADSLVEPEPEPERRLEPAEDDRYANRIKTLAEYVVANQYSRSIKESA